MTLPVRDRVAIFNARLDPLTLPQAVAAVFEQLAQRRRGWVCTVNVSMLMAMREDVALQRFVDRATIAVADGQPLRWVAPLFGGRLPERVTGIDLIDALCERAAREGRRVFLLGARADTVALAARRLAERHPGLRVGAADGYRPESHWPEQARAVHDAGAELLFVGMGVPRQERFIESQWTRLGCTVAVGVGGSFEVIAGRRRRAHRWLQRAGLEWAVRLAQEPQRLMRRYVVGNSRFCWLVLRRIAARLVGRGPQGTAT